MVRLATLVAAMGFASGQKDGTGDVFCQTGVVVPPQTLLEEKPVDVFVAQAPLFSVSGNQMFGLLGLYHTALVFRQERLDGQMLHWTLEFDAVEGPSKAVVPDISEVKGEAELKWQADARFCLTEGAEPLWGFHHWTKSFTKAATLSAAEVRRTFHEVVLPYNGTGPGTEPQYQLWNARPSSGHHIPDVTCADGVAWVLRFILDELQATPLPGLKDFKSSTVKVPAVRRMTEVNMSIPSEKAAVVSFYRRMKELGEGNGAAVWRRVLDFFVSFPMPYIHDGATGSYYKVSYRKAFRPFVGFRFSFEKKSLEKPPFQTEVLALV